MIWLQGADQPVPTEVVDTIAGRARGLLGRGGLDHALLLRPARSVHTVGMRFDIDVAHLDAEGTVLGVTTMAPNRIGRVVWRSRAVLEAAAGAFERWGVIPGVRLVAASASDQHRAEPGRR